MPFVKPVHSWRRYFNSLDNTIFCLFVQINLMSFWFDNFFKIFNLNIFFKKDSAYFEFLMLKRLLKQTWQDLRRRFFPIDLYLINKVSYCFEKALTFFRIAYPFETISINVIWVDSAKIGKNIEPNANKMYSLLF